MTALTTSCENGMGPVVPTAQFVTLLKEYSFYLNDNVIFRNLSGGLNQKCTSRLSIKILCRILIIKKNQFKKLLIKQIMLIH